MFRAVQLGRVIVLVVILMVMPPFVATSAQTPTEATRLVFEIADKVRFYQIDSAGIRTPIYELSADFAVLSHGKAEWIIPIPESIVVSPQADKIAFVAIQNYTDSALFWFDVHDPVLRQTPLPGLGGLQWSPDGRMILLFPDGVEISIPVYVKDAYVYSFEAGTLNPLVNPVNKPFGNFHWFDSHRILYRAQSEDCAAPCIDAGNLFLFELDTQTTTRLTDIGHQLPADAPNDKIQFYADCRADIVRWSSANNRLYYSVNCVDTADQVHSYLYSSDLSGGNQLEADLLTLQPENFYAVIQSIHVIDDTVYFTIESEIRPKGEGAAAIYAGWRIYALSNNGVRSIWEARFNEAGAAWLSAVEVSPDNRKLMVGGLDYTSDEEGYFAVVDLESGQIILQGHVPTNICEIEWLEATRVIYQQFSGICGSSFIAPTSFTVLNLATGEWEELISDFAGPVWMLTAENIFAP
ncbi:MAG TPA: hypothetical protein VHO69_19795 [Phototrophicaceae bacterium]|nr:hypothetical protein [Phototrophicaceae bacterium]